MSPPRHCFLQDHPRIRGEHTVAQSANGHGSGSSPHTRGAQIGVDLLEILPRIIPAYAGSTPAFGR